ncbi:molybdate ABC transporter substrate-binding protein [Rhizobiaceae sp. 2RAB30]
MKLRSLSLRAVFACGIAVIALSAAHADEATLAAGAGFRKPLTELAAAYEAQSGHKIPQTYGHLGQVVAQARESGKISIVCGDRAVLEKAKDIGFAKMVPLGLGKLVVAFRKGASLDRPEDLATDAFQKIGIPDQANAIYGKAGRQFLERAGLAEKIDPKLIAVATVPQVTSYVSSGEVDAGFVNATDAIGAGDNIGGFVEVPANFYDPVEVSCGAIESASPSPAADGFLGFLETDPARAILKRYGL